MFSTYKKLSFSQVKGRERVNYYLDTLHRYHANINRILRAPKSTVHIPLSENRLVLARIRICGGIGEK